MTLALPELPYAYNALQPYISQATLLFHHGKHHRAYVQRTNELAAEAHLTYQSLEAIITKTAGQFAHQELFNNAAQACNHGIYWHSIRPGGGGEPHGKIAARIKACFGDYQTAAKQLKDAVMGQFGSGWTWLVLDGDRLEITNTSNADTPRAHGQTPLLVIDVWEHAYYLDYQNDRAVYADAIINHLLNWEFANQNLSRWEAENKDRTRYDAIAGIKQPI